MIKNFPKELLPLFLIFGYFFLMLISKIFGLNNEDEGYFILILAFIIIYILIPLQVFMIILKIIYNLWKKFKK